ncbi:MAG: pyridoxine 5'-phosphate synthase [Muribaculaceae bacterium]|nr:pyridoxine 5'-phosphate synthase [Muribaculaceae bacterium]
MTRLSVNINKVATLRNARGENIPDVERFAIDCENFGAQGITVHPRPDERHITRRDVEILSKTVTTEFNIEGYPSQDFIDLVIKAAPAQATLVPDAPDALTSSAGWNVTANSEFLREVIGRLRNAGIRVSVFVDADPEQVRAAASIGADRVELYTKPYADAYEEDPQKAVEPFVRASEEARRLGIGLNAGHDLNLRNLRFFKESMPLLDEVSIGHAIISDALYMGIKETIAAYLACLKEYDRKHSFRISSVNPYI